MNEGTGNKYDTGKLRPDLLGLVGLTRLIQVYTIGAKKYGDRNMEGGMRWSRVVAAMLRHILRWMVGERDDPSDGQHHLASVAWCALTLMHYEITHPELNDLPSDPRVAKAVLRIFEDPLPKRAQESQASVEQLPHQGEQLSAEGMIRPEQVYVPPKTAEILWLESDITSQARTCSANVSPSLKVDIELEEDEGSSDALQGISARADQFPGQSELPYEGS